MKFGRTTDAVPSPYQFCTTTDPRVAHDPGDEHAPDAAGLYHDKVHVDVGVSRAAKSVRVVPTHAASYWTSADMSLEVAERRLALQLAFRRSEASPTDESAVLEVARLATGVANALRAARG